MNIHTLRSVLIDKPFGHTSQHHQTVPSTMPLARALAEGPGDPSVVSGTLVLADEQTAGRGRLDRRWVTPPGRALLVSIVVAGRHLPDRPAQLPLIAGLAVLDALRTIVTPDRCAVYENSPSEPTAPTHLAGVKNVDLRLKWPNDLVAFWPDDPKKPPAKIAGLLAESSLGHQGIRYAVLGIGVNVNQRADELPPPRPGGLLPASLYTLFGHEFDREELLIALCDSLTHLLARADRPNAAEIHARWQAKLVNIGRMVIVNSGERGDGRWRGRVVGTDLDGRLLVEDVAGQVVMVEAGDVSVEWYPVVK